MKLVVAIIEDDMSHDIIKLLAINKIRCTKLSSTGGVFKKGNTTLLIGAKEEQLDEIKSIIKETSNNRLRDPDDGDSYNANIFVISLKGSKRF
ncbi:cyclic-di-AMP receptor [Miniphocaeibacter massiliensis]|uniref:cyclic-di-AMP receptor n=1 Tax=Miniphocaeibacter massiliensis TaxID=2041841 RepID=UPI000C08279F|nr:cyclic-di-AMP receptor [Miniphocaeibacter massiliensis]